MIYRAKQVLNYYRVNGLTRTIKKTWSTLKGEIDSPIAHMMHAVEPLTVQDIGYAHFEQCRPLSVFTVPDRVTKRVTLVTDSISAGSFYGGVGTAIIFAALLAEARQAQLRIVTRTQPPQPDNVEDLFKAHQIVLSKDMQFVFSPSSNNAESIDILEDELFLTTSWWTTQSVLGAVREDRIIYILQEDERMFYGRGDAYYRCEEVLSNQKIRFLVNCSLLYDHLISSGLSNIADRGICFEPAFHREVFAQKKDKSKDKFKMMFYARRFNERNLYHFGIELIELAIARGIIDLDRWDILFFGKDIPFMKFSNGYTPQRFENLKWTEYGELISHVDLGLSLMYTPHPSYIPFDLATAGAVAVTNRCGIKEDLSHYSKNILCGDLNHESMLSTLAAGVQLAMNQPLRTQHHQDNQIVKDWRAAFSDALHSFSQ